MSKYLEKNILTNEESIQNDDKDLINEKAAYPNITPGDEVPGGFTYPENATVQRDSLYLRDANGNTIPGREISIGDKITVLYIDYDKQLALVQYPVGNPLEGVVRQGYVTNNTNIIQYTTPYNWANGSTSEQVFDENGGAIGSLSPYEKATILYKYNGKTNVVYDTGKGKNTKSGFVVYEGSGNNGGSGGGSNGINPGDVVPGGFTYPNNATVQLDSLYLRDANGNTIPGREISVGDKITVLDVGYSKQLALVQYPSGNDVRQGYVTNNTNIIQYDNPYNWCNGSTPEAVYSTATSNDSSFGTLSPYEAATLLYKEGNRYHVVYDTSKGLLTKSGYVNYGGTGATGGVDTDITIPSVSHSQAIREQYGTSGKGRPLNVYKIGNGSKVLFAGFAIHGWEDHWANDGLALVKIANALIERIGDYSSQNGLHGWTVYIAPCMNPDGVIVKGTNNGPGRCAVTSRVDMNRCFERGFSPQSTPRYYTGPKPLGAPEAVALKNFIKRINGNANELVVIDAHGWLGCTYGSSSISQYFTNQFGFSYKGESGGGFFSYWAQGLPRTRGLLLEYPTNTYSYNDVINGNYIGKTYNAIINILKNNPNGGGDTGNGGNNEESFNATGTIINVSSTLNVRSGPGTSYSAIGQLRGGDKVTIVAKAKPSSESKHWYKIVFGSGYGYVRSDFVDVNSSGGGNNNEESFNATGTIVNVSSTLNVRSGPGTSYSAIGQLRGGDKVTIVAKAKPISESKHWYKIVFGSGYGYVRSDFVDVNSSGGGNDNIEQLKKEKAEKAAKSFLQKVFPLMPGINYDLEILKLYTFGLPYGVLEFTYGVEPFFNDASLLKFKINDGKIDDESFVGKLANNGFDFLGAFNSTLKEVITKFKFEVYDGEVEVEVKDDISIDIKISKTINFEETGGGFKVYFLVNIKPALDKLNKKIKEKFNELMKKLEKIVSSTIVSAVAVLVVIAIIITPLDEIIMGLVAVVTFITTAAGNAIIKLLEIIFNVPIIPLPTFTDENKIL